MAKTKVIYRRPRSKRPRRRSGFTVPLAVVAGFGPPLAMTVRGFQAGGIQEGVNNLTRSMTGFDPITARWNIANMRTGALPVAVGIIVHKLAGMLGVNRALARANVPFIRV